MGSASVPAPTVDDLRAVVVRFTAFGDVDRSWLRYVQATAAAPDLSRADHRAATLTWLNSWNCRIPRLPEFGTGVGRWWSSVAIPPLRGLLDVGESDVEAIAAAYAGLVDVPVGRRRIGPTAASKLLYALRPAAVMPWDAAIAARLHGARDADAFAAHQRLGREWARAVTAAAGVSEQELPALVGRATVSLAKLLDEYTYLVALDSSR